MPSNKRPVRGDEGSVLVEFALTLPIFLILLFAVLDFGQVYMRWILAEKATQIAVRMAAVRPPVCPGVPAVNQRPAFVPDVLFGTVCGGLDTGICADPGAISCTGADEVGDTFEAMMAVIAPLLPAAVTAGDIVFTYEFAGLGFLGGPYVPMVTVEFAPGIDIPYVTPFGPLLALFYGDGEDRLAALSLPAMRATLPAEDLALGGAG